MHLPSPRPAGDGSPCPCCRTAPGQAPDMTPIRHQTTVNLPGIRAAYSRLPVNRHYQPAKYTPSACFKSLSRDLGFQLLFDFRYYIQYQHLMSRAVKLLCKMRDNPGSDWSQSNIKTLVRAFNLTLRQHSTSHAVITNRSGQHVTIPMHKPIKPIYIKPLVSG